jgi:hypothetical protein
MKKETELQFETRFEFDTLLVTFYSESPDKNRLHSVLLNSTYPLDVADINTDKQYRNLKQVINDAMANNSHSHWNQLSGCPFDELSTVAL